MKRSPDIKVSPVRRLLANSSWSTLGVGVGRILNLVAMILAARQLGIVDFGYFAFIVTAIGTLGIFAGASLGTTAIRFVSLYLTVDPARAGRIIGLVIASTIVLTGLIAIVAVLSSGAIASSMVESPPGALKLSLAIAALVVILISARGVQDSLLASFGAYREAAVLKFIEGLTIVLLLPGLAARHGLAGAVGSMVLALVLPLSLGFLRVKAHLIIHEINISWYGARDELPILFSFSLPAFISATLSLPLTFGALYLLGQQNNGIVEIALFNAAYQWYGPLIFIPLMMNSAGIPVLVQLWTSGELKKFRLVMMLLLAAGALIPGIPAFAIAIFGETIMKSYGPGFDLGVTPLVILVATAPIAAMARLCGTALESMSRAWVAMRGSVVWAFAFALCAPYLVQTYGATGVSLAFLLATCAQFLYVVVKLYTLIRMRSLHSSDTV